MFISNTDTCLELKVQICMYSYHFQMYIFGVEHQYYYIDAMLIHKLQSAIFSKRFVCVDFSWLNIEVLDNKSHDVNAKAGIVSFNTNNVVLCH